MIDHKKQDDDVTTHALKLDTNQQYFISTCWFGYASKCIMLNVLQGILLLIEYWCLPSNYTFRWFITRKHNWIANYASQTANQRYTVEKPLVMSWFERENGMKFFSVVIVTYHISSKHGKSHWNSRFGITIGILIIHCYK